ncbi:MAG: homoserine kinase [Chloroflexi bacterium]|nr:homoserine kinase [Chloroflexota bacterium]
MMQYIKLQKSDIHEIMRRYALETIGFEPIAEGAGNTNYLIKTTRGDYALTLFEIEKSRAIQICDLLNLLEEFKFPATRIQRLPNGSVMTSYRGKSVLLKPYIIGDVKKNLDENMLHQIGEKLAELHEIPLPRSTFLPEKHPYGLHTFSRVLKKGIDPDYERWLEGKYALLKKNIPEGLPYGLTHGDLFYDNVLFDGDEFKAMLDFEEAAQYYKIFDIGMALLGICLKDSQIALDKARSLIKGYQKIRMLTTQEKESLKLFIEYAAISTSSWRFWKYNIDTPIAEISMKYMEMVKIANNVGAVPNRIFMDVIFN